MDGGILAFDGVLVVTLEHNPIGATHCTRCNSPFKQDRDVYPGAGKFDAFCRECWLTVVDDYPDIPKSPKKEPRGVVD